MLALIYTQTTLCIPLNGWKGAFERMATTSFAICGIIPKMVSSECIEINAQSWAIESPA